MDTTRTALRDCMMYTTSIKGLNSKIESVRYVRERTGTKLSQAKAIVEGIYAINSVLQHGGSSSINFADMFDSGKILKIQTRKSQRNLFFGKRAPRPAFLNRAPCAHFFRAFQLGKTISVSKKKRSRKIYKKSSKIEIQ